MTEQEIISEYMRSLGKRTSERKRESSVANLRNRPLKACTCGQEPHRYNCPVYAREAEARRRANKISCQCP